MCGLVNPGNSLEKCEILRLLYFHDPYRSSWIFFLVDCLPTLLMMIALIAFVHSLLVAIVASQDNGSQQKQPIQLDRSGGFQIGGKVISDPSFPNATLSCDHGYME